jgi:hypothetical protein
MLHAYILTYHHSFFNTVDGSFGMFWYSIYILALEGYSMRWNIATLIMPGVLPHPGC